MQLFFFYDLKSILQPEISVDPPTSPAYTGMQQTAAFATRSAWAQSRKQRRV